MGKRAKYGMTTTKPRADMRPPYQLHYRYILHKRFSDFTSIRYANFDFPVVIVYTRQWIYLSGRRNSERNNAEMYSSCARVVSNDRRGVFTITKHDWSEQISISLRCRYLIFGHQSVKKILFSVFEILYIFFSRWCDLVVTYFPAVVVDVGRLYWVVVLFCLSDGQDKFFLSACWKLVFVLSRWSSSARAALFITSFALPHVDIESLINAGPRFFSSIFILLLLWNFYIQDAILFYLFDPLFWSFTIRFLFEG